MIAPIRPQPLSTVHSRVHCFGQVQLFLPSYFSTSEKEKKLTRKEQETLQIQVKKLYLKKVVLHNVSDDSKLVKVSSSSLGSKGFLEGDGDACNGVSVPRWTEDHV